MILVLFVTNCLRRTRRVIVALESHTTRRILQAQTSASLPAGMSSPVPGQPPNAFMLQAPSWPASAPNNHLGGMVLSVPLGAGGPPFTFMGPTLQPANQPFGLNVYP